MNELCVLLAITCLSACEPRTGVRVVRDGNSYVVVVLNCSWTRAIAVRDLEVYREAAGQASEVVCALVPDVGGGLLERWRYGTDAVGFQRKACSPLERGAAYEIKVGTRPLAPRAVS
jgi:hypothetical protein